MKKKNMNDGIGKGIGIRRAALVGVIGILMLSVSATMVVRADLTYPDSLYGTVTVDGVDAPIGTIVRGEIVGAVGSPGEGSITVTEAGKYGGPGGFDPKLEIITDSHNDDGKPIKFYVKRPSDTVEIEANENATCNSYFFTTNQLGLTVITGAPVNGTVAGKIAYTCNGTGIADVEVNLTDGSVVASTTTDGDGNYTFNDVLPGDYYVNASKIRFWDNSTAATVTAGNTTEANMMLWLKGDLDGNCTVADAQDLLLMKQACLRLIAGDWKYDLNGNGRNGDIGDLVLLKRASLGEIVL